MPAKVSTATTNGLTVHPITVEVDLTPGLHSFAIVGLPDKAVEEAKERVNSAIKNSGAKEPRQHNRRVVVNLAPAELKKQGPGFDLPIALAFLAASEQIQIPLPEDFLFLGELALDGSLRPVSGVLPIARFAREHGKVLAIPEDNGREADLVRGLRFLPLASLKDFFSWHEHGAHDDLKTGRGVEENLAVPEWDFDFAAISGQPQAKRALEIAAAGHHNVLLSGPPGSGKTLLARAIPSILPPLSEEEALECTSIWSVAGMLSREHPLVSTPPFRSPHHTSTYPAIIGGGHNLRPGEVSLAHRGALFLDEFPEFMQNVLAALRQPMEDGAVTISRAVGTITYPARFMLVAAQNPCPCGHRGDADRVCICSPGQVLKYQRKISGPILDRIDLTVHVPRVRSEELLAEARGETSEDVRERVLAGRELQARRLAKYQFKTNAEIPAKFIRKLVPLNPESERMVASAIEKMGLSGRGLHRILRVSRTIADLAGSESVTSDHIGEALQYRHEQALESF